MALHPVVSTGDLPPGTSRCFEIAGHRIAVFHTEDGFLAIDDTCPHDGGPLSEGVVNEGCVACPLTTDDYPTRGLPLIRNIPDYFIGAILRVAVEPAPGEDPTQAFRKGGALFPPEQF